MANDRNAMIAAAEARLHDAAGLNEDLSLEQAIITLGLKAVGQLVTDHRQMTSVEGEALGALLLILHDRSAVVSAKIELASLRNWKPTLRAL